MPHYEDADEDVYMMKAMLRKSRNKKRCTDTVPRGGDVQHVLDVRGRRLTEAKNAEDRARRHAADVSDYKLSMRIDEALKEAVTTRLDAWRRGASLQALCLVTLHDHRGCLGGDVVGDLLPHLTHVVPAAVAMNRRAAATVERAVTRIALEFEVVVDPYSRMGVREDVAAMLPGGGGR